MAIYNLFVKLLNGKTLTLKLPSPTITGASLKSHLHTLTQIPLHHQRLLTGTHQIHDQTLITLPHDTVHLLLRLLGGKGGFGSLLRGAATKAGQKKTNNFDACRDMSGRRLRHVNAEKRLEEWKVEAEERRLEKVAEEFVKKRVKEGKKLGSGVEQKYIDKYREDSRKCREVVEAAVMESIGGVLDGKRKGLASSGSTSKRLKLWMGKENAEESDSDDEEDEDEDEDDESSTVLNGVNPIGRRNDGEGSSQSVLELPASEGESSGGGSMHSNLEEENGNANSECFEVAEGSGSGKDQTESNGLAESKVAICEQVGCETESACAKESVLESGVSKETVDPTPDNSIPEVREGSEIRDKVEELNGSDAIAATEVENPPKKPVDFDDYNTAEEMEVLGLETLKAELQSHGLKFGGTLLERAARLFLLKTTPVEKLPKKLFAKR